MTREKLRLYLCLTPIVGIVPAILAMVKGNSSAQLKSVGRASLLLFLVWAGVYGPTHNSDVIFTELVNGGVSSLYFVISLWLMVKVAQNKFHYKE